MVQQPIKSPCIGVCKLEAADSGNDVCQGCHRTLDEIVQWRSMSDEQRETIINRVLANLSPAE